MKKIIVGILFVLTLTGILSYIFLNKADAALTHNVELDSSYIDTDHYEVRVYNLYFVATENTEINHVEGYIDMAGYELVSFEVKDDFVKEKLDLETYEFEFTSNHVYGESDGKIVYATVTVKRNDENECHFLFHPNKASKENTNNVSITKDAIRNYGTDEIINEVNEGDTFFYKITIKNNSVIPTDNVVLTDTIPDELEILDSDNGIIDGQDITWNIGSMEVDEEQNFYVQVRLKNESNRQNFNINNTATVTVGDIKKSDDAEIDILYSDIEITKKASKDQIRPGDTFTYTLTIKNNGTGTSKNVIVTDTLDNDLVLISADKTYTKNNNEYSFNIGTLEAKEEISINLEVRLNRTSTKENINNTAIAKEEEKDPVEDEVITPVVDSNITIEKTASEEKVRIGDTFTYEIKVTNTGDVASRPIVISDSLDNRLEFVSASVGSASNNNYSYTIDSLDVDETIIITITVRVKNNANMDEQIRNIVIAEEDGKDPVNDEEIINVYDSNVTINKTANKKTVNVGEEFTYTITIKNTSDYDSRQITVVDTIDSSLTIVNAPNANQNGNTLTYNVGILKAHETKVYEITVKAKTNISDNTKIKNVAILKEVGKEDKEDEEEITVVKPNLTVTKRAITGNSTKLVRPNDEFEYEIIVTNTGNGDSSKVTIQDTINDQLTILDAGNGNVTDQTITWTIDTIRAKENVTLKVKVKVNANVPINTVIPNEVIVTHEDEELKDDDDVTVTDSLITINKKASVETIKKGGSFYYTIVVSNIGTEEETNLTLTDQIPEELSITDVNIPSKINMNLKDNLVTLTIPSIAPSETIEIKIYVEVVGNVKENDKIENTATLTYDDKKIESSDDVLIIDSNLNVEKTASKDHVSIDEELSYTITITNFGKANAQNIEVIDTFDEALEIIDTDNGFLDNENHTITWQIDNIEAGQSITLNIKTKVKQTEKDKVINHVVIHEPEKPDKEDEVEVDIGNPTLKITKDVNVDQVMSGDEFEYYITVENTSDFNAPNLSVTDLFDERLMIIESNGGIISGNQITWTFDLVSNSSITFTIKVRVLDDVEEGEIKNIATLHKEEEEIPSNEVIVTIVDIINPQTGSIVKYLLIIGCLALSTIIIIYVKKHQKIFKI